jgi:8-oxo-dGTP pyrophosphatase MutT (NUDIX family)
VPTPRYITELRQVWGSRPLLLPGVSGVVLREVDGSRRVLLVQRADNGRWSVPAGIVEPGEQPADCIARELWEEARVRAVPDRLLRVSADAEVTYPNGDRCQFMSMTFGCRYVAGDGAVGDDESLAVGWFPVDALPPLEPKDQRRIQDALSPGAACRFDVGG